MRLKFIACSVKSMGKKPGSQIERQGNHDTKHCRRRNVTKSKHQYLKLTISDPQRCSITLKYPKFFYSYHKSAFYIGKFN